MARYPHDDEDEDARRRGRILRDGEVMRVPMTMRDSKHAWRDGSENDSRRSSIHDGQGNPTLHRPGFVYPTESSFVEDARERAYREHDEAEQNRWRSPASVGAGSNEFVLATEGDLCTVREGGRDEGAPGRLRRIDGRGLVCVPDTPRQDDSASMFDERDAAYQMTDWEAENAWRGREWLAANRPTHFPRGR